MTLHLIRYHLGPDLAKGRLLIDGSPFCETREPSLRLPAGTYTCRCSATRYSPMTLRVCRRRGQHSVLFGWDSLRQHLSGTILVGMANADEPPDLRELTRQQDTFAQLTRRIYRAYAEAEDISLRITDPLSPAPAQEAENPAGMWKETPFINP